MPTAVAVAISTSLSLGAVASAIVSFVVNAIFNAILSAVLGSILGPDQPDLSSLGRGRTQLVRSSVENHRIVYGTVLLSGPLVYIGTTGDENKYLHMVIVIAAHEVEEIGDVYFNDKLATVYDSNLYRITKHLGATDQSADPDLVEEVEEWTTAHTLNGRAYIYARLKYEQEKWPSGVPNIKAVVKGKKVYDPRSTITEFSNNWALCARDYITDTAYGLSATSDEIDEANMIAAANICDEQVVGNIESPREERIGDVDFNSLDWWNKYNGTTILDGKACINYTGTSAIVLDNNDLDVLLDSISYGYFIDIIEYVSGSLEVYLGTVLVETISANGSYSGYSPMDASNITFKATNFEGFIDSVSVISSVLNRSPGSTELIKTRYLPTLGDTWWNLYNGTTISTAVFTGSSFGNKIYFSYTGSEAILLDKTLPIVYDGQVYIISLQVDSIAEGSFIDVYLSGVGPYTIAATGSYTWGVLPSSGYDFVIKSSNATVTITNVSVIETNKLLDGSIDTSGITPQNFTNEVWISSNDAINPGEFGLIPYNNTITGTVIEAGREEFIRRSKVYAGDKRNLLRKNTDYKFTYVISSYTSGTIYGQLGSTKGIERSSAGIFTEILNSGSGTYIQFGATDFIGEIDTLYIIPLSKPGSAFPRYTCDGIIDTGNTQMDILDQLLAGSAGTLAFTQGLYKLFPAAYDAPSATLDETNLRGELTISASVPQAERINSVKGVFIDEENFWQATDFPKYPPQTVTNPYLIEDNGIEHIQNLELYFTTDIASAQRLAKIALLKTRQEIIVQMHCDFSVLEIGLYDTIQLSIDRLGWDDKVFRVINWIIAEEGGVDLTLREEAADTYDWDYGELPVIDTAPNTNLDDFTRVNIPENLALYCGEDELFISGDGTIISRIKVVWDAPDDGYIIRYELQYKLNSNNIWTELTSTSATQYYINNVAEFASSGESYDVRVRAVNSLNISSDWVIELDHQVAGKSTPPTDPTGFAASIKQTGIFLKWNSNTDVDIGKYEIREGTDWNTGVVVTQTKSTSYLFEIKTAATYNFWIKAIDTSGNYSTGTDMDTVVITAPETPILNSSIEGENIILSWNIPIALYPIDDYELRYGASWAAGTYLARIKATSFSRKVEYLNRTYWLGAYDIAGNESIAASEILNITPPGTPVLNTEKINNNIFIRWDDTGLEKTLPINHYEIRKGTTFATAAVLQKISGTYVMFIEPLAGTYTYWVVAVDTAGNYGVEQFVTLDVTNPPNLTLQKEWVSTFQDQSDTKVTQLVSSLIKNDGHVLYPVDITETYYEHYTTPSPDFTTIQSQIDAGFEYWLQPSDTSSTYEEIFDAGITYPASTASYALTTNTIDGVVTKTKTISVGSATALSSLTGPDGNGEYTQSVTVEPDDVINSVTVWTRGTAGVLTANQWDWIAGTLYTDSDISADGQAVNWNSTAASGAIFGNDVRFAKFNLSTTAADGNDLEEMTTLALRMEAIILNDGSNDTITTASTGKSVTVTESFAKIVSITATPIGTTNAIAVVDFDFTTINPTTFTVYLYNDSGTKITGDFSWSARGY